MIIEEIHLKSFKIKLLNNFKTSKKTYDFRYGWYVILVFENHKGIGEISPLRKYSPDYNKPILKKINFIIDELNILKKDFETDDYMQLLNYHLSDYPSILFGFETALYDLLSKKKGIPLAKYWNQNYTNIIYSNSIFTNQNKIEEYNNVIKIKVVKDDIEDYKSIMNMLKKHNKNIKFRLDFNGCLNFERAIKWADEFLDYNIEYFEQPMSPSLDKMLKELCSYSQIPIAIDESLVNIDSIYEMITNKSADVFILKPMILGGYHKSKSIIKLASFHNIKCIFTTTLESEIGLLANIHIAAALNIKDYCGFSTWNLFSQQPLEYIKNLNILIGDKPGLGKTNEHLV